MQLRTEMPSERDSNLLEISSSNQSVPKNVEIIEIEYDDNEAANVSIVNDQLCNLMSLMDIYRENLNRIINNTADMINQTSVGTVETLDNNNGNGEDNGGVVTKTRKTRCLRLAGAWTLRLVSLARGFVSIIICHSSLVKFE